MFIALLLNPILCFYHIIIHSLFKSILFLFAGSLIHIQYNYQNVYQIKSEGKFYWITYLLTSSILVLSISKEIIIHDIVVLINSPFTFVSLSLGAIFTILYAFKAFIFTFLVRRSYRYYSRPNLFSFVIVLPFARSSLFSIFSFPYYSLSLIIIIRSYRSLSLIARRS